MIISKKKFNEKVREALEQADRERWLHEKIDRVDRECQERIDAVQRHCFELEKQIAVILDEKNHLAKLKKKHTETSSADFKEEFIKMLVDNWKWGEEE